LFGSRRRRHVETEALRQAHAAGPVGLGEVGDLVALDQPEQVAGLGVVVIADVMVAARSIAVDPRGARGNDG
jgi:hypothetical protein